MFYALRYCYCLDDFLHNTTCVTNGTSIIRPSRYIHKPRFNILKFYVVEDSLKGFIYLMFSYGRRYLSDCLRRRFTFNRTRPGYLTSNSVIFCLALSSNIPMPFLGGQCFFHGIDL